MRDELVVEDRAVGLDLDEVDRDGRDLTFFFCFEKEVEFFRFFLFFSSPPPPISSSLYSPSPLSPSLTSAIMILRRAFAKATSTPASTNSQ